MQQYDGDGTAAGSMITVGTQSTAPEIIAEVIYYLWYCLISYDVCEWCLICEVVFILFFQRVRAAAATAFSGLPRYVVRKMNDMCISL